MTTLDHRGSMIAWAYRETVAAYERGVSRGPETARMTDMITVTLIELGVLEVIPGDATARPLTGVAAVQAFRDGRIAGHRMTAHGEVILHTLLAMLEPERAREIAERAATMREQAIAERDAARSDDA